MSAYRDDTDGLRQRVEELEAENGALRRRRPWTMRVALAVSLGVNILLVFEMAMTSAVESGVLWRALAYLAMMAGLLTAVLAWGDRVARPDVGGEICECSNCTMIRDGGFAPGERLLAVRTRPAAGSVADNKPITCGCRICKALRKGGMMSGEVISIHRRDESVTRPLANGYVVRHPIKRWSHVDLPPVPLPPGPLSSVATLR